MSSAVFPNAERAAVSLSFDDARLSQIDVGIPLLNSLNVRATFYVCRIGIEKRLDGWKEAIVAGHEIGNHTLNHPCTGNFSWSRGRALEDYTLDRMEQELLAANDMVQSLLGVTPKTYAYPCGQTF